MSEPGVSMYDEYTDYARASVQQCTNPPSMVKADSVLSSRSGGLFRGIQKPRPRGAGGLCGRAELCPGSGGLRRL